MGKRPPITNRVREYREEHGKMSQAALGEAVGVTRRDAQAPCSPCFFCASCFACLHEKADGTDAYAAYEKYAYYHE